MRSHILQGIKITSPNQKIPPLLKQFFEIRKRLFIDEYGWDIAHYNGLEYDQYDHQEAFYSLLTEKGKVVAGSRFLRTDCQVNGWSYMIRDACLGRLNQLPDNLIENPPQSKNEYEITRFTIEPTLPLFGRIAALRELAIFNAEILAHLSAKRAWALSDPSLLKWLNHWGFPSKTAGPVIKRPKETYCVLSGMIAPTKEAIVA